MSDRGERLSRPGTRRPTTARIAFAGALALVLAAALALWASEGASVFAEQAFAALVACF